MVLHEWFKIIMKCSRYIMYLIVSLLYQFLLETRGRFQRFWEKSVWKTSEIRLSKLIEIQRFRVFIGTVIDTNVLWLRQSLDSLQKNLWSVWCTRSLLLIGHRTIVFELIRRGLGWTETGAEFWMTVTSKVFRSCSPMRSGRRRRAAQWKARSHHHESGFPGLLHLQV